MDFPLTPPGFEIAVSLSLFLKSLHFIVPVSCNWDDLILHVEVQVSLAFRKLLIALLKSAIARNIFMLRVWLAAL